LMRKQEHLRRIEYYHDLQLDFLRMQLTRHFADASKITPMFINVTRKVINNIARVYIYPVTRQIVKGSTTDTELFQAIALTSSLGRKLKLASRYCKLLKTLLLRPIWRDGHMDLDLITGDKTDVTYGDVPEQLLSVKITIYPDSGKLEDLTYSLWTAQEFQTLDYRNKVIASQPNPYGVLPFVPIWDGVPVRDFWIDGGDDLITAQDAVNERLTDLCYVLRLQGYGQPYTIGVPQSTDFYLGPGAVTQLPQGCSMGFASTNAPISAIIEAIKFLIGQTAVSYGLSAHILIDEPERSSGISKIISSQELDEARQDEVELFMDYEHNLFNMFKVLWNHHNPGKQFSKNAELKVSFEDPKPEVDPLVQANAWTALMGMGVISPVDIVMARNPDITSRQDALAYLLTVESEMRTLNEGYPITPNPGRTVP